MLFWLSVAHCHLLFSKWVALNSGIVQVNYSLSKSHVTASTYYHEVDLKLEGHDLHLSPFNEQLFCLIFQEEQLIYPSLNRHDRIIPKLVEGMRVVIFHTGSVQQALLDRLGKVDSPLTFDEWMGLLNAMPSAEYSAIICWLHEGTEKENFMMRIAKRNPALTIITSIFLVLVVLFAVLMINHLVDNMKHDWLVVSCPDETVSNRIYGRKVSEYQRKIFDHCLSHASNCNVTIVSSKGSPAYDCMLS